MRTRFRRLQQRVDHFSKHLTTNKHDNSDYQANLLAEYRYIGYGDCTYQTPKSRRILLCEALSRLVNKMKKMDRQYHSSAAATARLRMQQTARGQASSALSSRNGIGKRVTEVFTCLFSLDPSRHPDVGFMHLGLDSLDIEAVADAVSLELGCRVPPATLFDYPTLSNLVDHLKYQLEDRCVPEMLNTPSSLIAHHDLEIHSSASCFPSESSQE